MHRSQWHCQFCRSHSPYTSREAFKSHLQRQHGGKFVEAQLSTLIRICQQPVDRIASSDCPFCDEWESILRTRNAYLASEKIVVTPVEFRNHVAAHMEQLALFAVPLSAGTDEEASADSNAANFEQKRSLSHVHPEKTLSTSSAGDSVDEKDPLSFAVSHGLDAEVAQLLEHDSNLSCLELFAALREAGAQGHLSTVNVILDKFDWSIVLDRYTRSEVPKLVHFVSETGHKEEAALIEQRLELYNLRQEIDAGFKNLMADTLRFDDRWEKRPESLHKSSLETFSIRMLFEEVRSVLRSQASLSLQFGWKNIENECRNFLNRYESKSDLTSSIIKILMFIK